MSTQGLVFKVLIIFGLNENSFPRKQAFRGEGVGQMAGTDRGHS